MRKIALSLIVLCLFISMACESMDPIPDAEKQLLLVKDINGKPKDQLFLSIQIWVAENFKSGKEVLELVDKDAGLLIGNARIVTYSDGTFSTGFSYSFRIKVEDNRFRILYKNFGAFGRNPDRPLETKYQSDRLRPRLVALTDQMAEDIQADQPF